MNFFNLKFFKYLRFSQHKILMSSIMALLGLSSYVGYKVPQVISSIYENYENETFKEFIVLGFVIFLIQYLVRSIYQVLISFYVKSLIEKLRNDLFSNWIYSQDKIITDSNYFIAQDKYTRGELQARMINDTESLRELIRSGSLTIFIDFIFIVSCMISFLNIHTFYGIVLIVAELVICFVLIWVSKFMVKSFTEVRKENGKLSRILSSLSQGFHSLFYSNSKDYALNSAIPRFDKFLSVQLRANFWDASYYSFAESLYPIILVVIVIVFPYSFVTKVAIFAAILDLVQRSIGPIKNVASKISAIQRAMTGIRRITELEKDLSHYNFKSNGLQEIKVNSMSFNIDDFFYDKEKKNFKLDKIKANLKKGEKIGIIGQSGSGKSTVLKLLSGDIFSDKININLHSEQEDINFSMPDLRDVNILRKYFCLVSQDSYLFSNTLEFNITFEEESSEKFADFWEQMKEKIPYIKTWEISPGDIIQPSEISLGQKQLISALRFCYQKKPIVLLDEISSALDGELEQALSDFIDFIQEDVMMIIVAHRVETLTRCNKILYLDKGEQIAIDSHQELMKNYTDYANFFKMLKSTQS